MRCLLPAGTSQTLTYSRLQVQTNRFAALLHGLGVGPGQRVFTLAGRIPQLYIAALGTLKNGSVFCPLFAAFGPEPIFQRLHRGDARVLVTTAALYRSKVAELRGRLPQLAHVLLIDADPAECPPGCLALEPLMAAATPPWRLPATTADDMALLHFTSGTTGLPKGAVHVQAAVMTHFVTGLYVLDFHPGDVFWCTADPGWVTGTSYGIIAPLVHGITTVVDAAEFDAERWLKVLEAQRVTVFYTSPTAIRRLMRLPPERCRRYDLSRLRLVHSVGEPLNPEAVLWGRDILGCPVHDNWWQTETGGIMIANYPAMEIRPGSMGRPLPGIDAAVVRRREDGRLMLLGPGESGELALRAGWPSMFRGYLHEPERYRKCFADGWYLTGDMVRQDADGYFWFVGRADDLIKTAGHLVGPFEIENILMAHPAVAEAGVIGKPDPFVGELVKAFVSLKPGVVAEEGLKREIIGFARRRLGAVVAPREIEFQADLPKNRAGKIMRRLLKARETGQEPGDTSTLEPPA